MSPDFWVAILDKSLAVAIASVAAYSMLRLYERMERARREQVGEVAKILLRMLETSLGQIQTKLDEIQRNIKPPP